MPSLQFKAYIKNGFIHNGKQKYACKDCGRQFIDNPQHLWDMLDKLLLEKIQISWYFQGNWDFRALVAALYQPKVRACAPRHRPLKKKLSHGRVWWNVVVCWNQKQ